MPRKLTALANASASNNASLLSTGVVIDGLDGQLEEEQLQKDEEPIFKMRDHLTVM